MSQDLRRFPVKKIHRNNPLLPFSVCNISDLHIKEAETEDSYQSQRNCIVSTMKTTSIILTSNHKTVTYPLNTCFWQAVQQCTCNPVLLVLIESDSYL